jgi:formylglycine-generating enzyme required for sulfatase activity
MDLVRVPEGEFLMGSDSAKDPMAVTDEDPQLSVTLAEFYIGLHEVTNAQYEAFVVATGRVAPESWEAGRVPRGKEDHPVANVSWDDAVAFAQWLGEETGLDFRLCTEAEWEKACRGDAGSIYPWGDAFDADLANTVESGIEDTTEVDAFSPDGDGPYGVAGMSGNVQEWVADWYDGSYYDYAPAENPPGPESGSERVARGGSFWDDERTVRCAFRTAADPANRSAGTGFRVCVSPP